MKLKQIIHERTANFSFFPIKFNGNFRHITTSMILIFESKKSHITLILATYDLIFLIVSSFCIVNRHQGINQFFSSISILYSSQIAYFDPFFSFIHGKVRDSTPWQNFVIVPRITDNLLLALVADMMVIQNQNKFFSRK